MHEVFCGRHDRAQIARTGLVGVQQQIIIVQITSDIPQTLSLGRKHQRIRDRTQTEIISWI